MSPMLPDDILYRRKQGFAIPLGQWFRQELKEMAEKTLFDSNDGILDPAFLRKIWNQHQRGHHDRSAHLWSVLMFRKWKETFAA
jgi:asparagine synthase (glutamine-hydrolysing)